MIWNDKEQVPMLIITLQHYPSFVWSFRLQLHDIELIFWSNIDTFRMIIIWLIGIMNLLWNREFGKHPTSQYIQYQW